MAVKTAIEKQLQKARKMGVNVPDSAAMAMRHAAQRWSSIVTLHVNSKIPLRRKVSAR